MHSPSGRLPPQLDESVLEADAHDAAADAALLDLSDTRPAAFGRAMPWPPAARLARALRAPYAPEACGPEDVRGLVAAHATAPCRAARADDVVLAASTSEAFSWLLKWWCPPGATVVHMVPGYPLFAHLAEAEGLVPVPLSSRLHAGRWQLDLGGLERALGAGATAVVLTSPNNPTGACLAPEEARAVAAACNRHRALCIVDAVFAPYGSTEGGQDLGPLEGCQRLVALGGLSKFALWPQAKLAWMVLGGSPAFRHDARIGLTWLGDLYLSVSAVAAELGRWALPLAAPLQARVRRRLGRNQAWARRALPALGVGELLPVDGGFVAPVILFGACRRALGLGAGGHGLERLEARAQVRLAPAHLFDLPAPIDAVASLLLPPARLQRGWRRLAGALVGND